MYFKINLDATLKRVQDITSSYAFRKAFNALDKIHGERISNSIDLIVNEAGINERSKISDLVAAVIEKSSLLLVNYPKLTGFEGNEFNTEAIKSAEYSLQSAVERFKLSGIEIVGNYISDEA